MKILLTGGAGYIGSHTAVELIKAVRYACGNSDNGAMSERNMH